MHRAVDDDEGLVVGHVRGLALLAVAGVAAPRLEEEVEEEVEEDLEDEVADAVKAGKINREPIYPFQR